MNARDVSSFSWVSDHVHIARSRSWRLGAYRRHLFTSSTSHSSIFGDSQNTGEKSAVCNESSQFRRTRNMKYLTVLITHPRLLSPPQYIPLFRDITLPEIERALVHLVHVVDPKMSGDNNHARFAGDFPRATCEAQYSLHPRPAVPVHSRLERHSHQLFTDQTASNLPSKYFIPRIQILRFL